MDLCVGLCVDLCLNGCVGKSMKIFLGDLQFKYTDQEQM